MDTPHQSATEAIETPTLLEFFRQRPDEWFSQPDLEHEIGVEIPTSLLFHLSVISKKLQVRKADDGSYVYRLDFRQVPLPAEINWDALMDNMDVLAFVVFKEIYRHSSLSAPELCRMLKNRTDYSDRTILKRIHWLADRGLVRIVLSKPLLFNARHELGDNPATFIELYKHRRRLV